MAVSHKILRNILNGKLKLGQNLRKADTDTEEEDDDEDDDEEEMPEATGRQTYDNCERNGKYIPIQTNPEDDAIQIHINGEISVENTETIIQCSNRNVHKLNRYGSIP